MKELSREYKIFIPVNVPLERLDTWGEYYAKLAKDLNAEFFITTKNVFGDKELFLKNMEELKTKVQFFKERGVEVGAWLCPTTGHEGMGLFVGEEGKKFTRRQVADYSNGKPELIENAFCPLDENFTKDFAWKMQQLCQTGIKHSLFEDDFRLSGPPITKVACCCPLHLEAYSKRIGRDVSLEELRDLIYNNEDLSYRKEWMELKRETMVNFLKALRDAVDEINPDFRIGISASRLNYDIDGATIQELAKVAAGKNKPLVRLTGAPYWARENNTLSAVIESNRMQFGWFMDSDIEIITEGDPYPRPRTRMPAAYLEMFDQILRASGDNDGIMKYVTAYTQGPGYEEGFINFHKKNEETYKLIDKLFDGKKAVGLRPYVKQQKITNAIFDDLEPFEEFGSFYRLDSVVPPENYLATACSIPTTYEDVNCAGIAFGESARYLTDKELNNGIITDLKGAKILMEKGIDVGLNGYTPVRANPGAEYFLKEKLSSGIANPSTFPLRFYRADLKEGAIIQSMFIYTAFVPSFGNYKASFGGNEERVDFPACYLYENANGQRFCVYTFVATNVQNRNIYDAFNGDFFANYLRQSQIFDAIEWVQKKKMPAKSLKNPYLYLLCAEDETSRTIGLWNICEDEILQPKIELDGPAKDAKFYQTEGYVDGQTIYLTKPVKPYECAFIEYKK